MKQVFILLILLLIGAGSSAKEGMWLPLLIEKYNIGEMQANGFQLSAEDLYSVNQASMKDGIVKFGNGCTGVIVSKEGLVFTNHHCGFKYIQRHSSLEKDYLKDGFWAMNKDEELSNPGLTVTILKEMHDVSDAVLKGTTDDMSAKARKEIIRINIDTIIAHAVKDNHYKAEVDAFFEGNQYFLFINEVFEDVRLVGAPPSSVGGFGGNIDNWMWPRHGGDFSVFRIYADENNKPKTYSNNNVPYKAAYSFPVSLGGIQENDFTMVFGFPGTTQEYKTSFHLEMLTESLYPALIQIRDKKLDIINYHMDMDAERRIKYAGKEASLSNSWKRWRGEIKGLDRFEVINKKIAAQKDFQSWASGKAQYTDLLNTYKTLYASYSKINTDAAVLKELFFKNTMECFRKAYDIHSKIEKASLKNTALERKVFEPYYKDFDIEVDTELTENLLSYLYNYGNKTMIPETLKDLYKKKKGNVEKISSYLYKKSFIEDSLWISTYFKNNNRILKKLEKDPFKEAYNEYLMIYNYKLLPEKNRLAASIDSLDRIYMQAILAFEPNKVFYPDANSTLRISYGKVKGYKPRDGVYYKYYTSSNGILQKDNPLIYDYNVPDKLKQLLKAKDFGSYAQNGVLHVDFIASNHTTGGNSGSPVFNKNGELIGLNFDRAWDGVMSDLYYNPEICRNITVDIRYILFIIDKFAGAGYLLDEMKIVR